MPVQTILTQLLSLARPIIQAPIAGVATTAELLAVYNAGALASSDRIRRGDGWPGDCCNTGAGCECGVDRHGLSDLHGGGLSRSTQGGEPGGA